MRSDSRSLHSPGRLPREAVKRAVEEYTHLHDEVRGGDAEARRRDYRTLVTHYYDLVTDFYELGWGPCFHFAPRKRGESFRASLARHERFLADRLELRPGMKVLDVGCGVGGPMREIARYSGADITGINNNAYQIARGRRHVAGLEERCRFLQADFMRIPVRTCTYDAAYIIEATVHAPDKTAMFGELHRVLEPGGRVAGYEWCLTERYRRADPTHQRIKKAIEVGNALPDIASTAQICDALRKAGFDLLEHRDLAADSDPETPWYRALQSRDISLAAMARTPLGRALTNVSLRALEAMRIVPPGMSEVSTFLNRGADALVAGGEGGIFTPMFFFHARKPHTS